MQYTTYLNIRFVYHYTIPCNGHFGKDSIAPNISQKLIKL